MQQDNDGLENIDCSEWLPPTDPAFQKERLRKIGAIVDYSPDRGGIEIRAIDNSIAAFFIAEEILTSEHAAASRRYRALRDAYDLLFYARQGRAFSREFAGGDERMMADDYLYLRKRLHPFDRTAIDRGCFTEAHSWDFDMLRARTRPYIRAFDRLCELFQELDDERNGRA